MFSIHREVLLVLKKVWIIKITIQVPSPGKNFPTSKIFNAPPTHGGIYTTLPPTLHRWWNLPPLPSTPYRYLENPAT